MRGKAWNLNILYAPYYLESGPRTTFGLMFRTWWKEYFRRQGSKVAHVKVKFSLKSNRTLEQCFCAKEALKRNVEENGQYTGNNHWTMTVKKAKLALIRQYYCFRTICIYNCILCCCEKRH